MNEKLKTALEMVAQTDPGVVRTHNEDSVAMCEAIGLVVLADGMGGYNAGEVASGMATALLANELEKRFTERSPAEQDANGVTFAHEAFVTEIARANGAIYHAARSQPQYSGMGTTLVTAVFHNNALTVAHIGDSRLYRWRDNALSAITKDHSFLQEQIDGGLITKEQARQSQNKNLVTKALGVDPEVEPSIQTIPVLAGDIYLLCSDGLNDMVDDEEIGDTVGMLAANLTLCASQLIQLANDNGGRDNVSVILVKVKDDFAEASGGRGWLGWLGWFREIFASWFK